LRARSPDSAGVRSASADIRGENPGLTLQATSLLHEAWIRLAGNCRPDALERLARKAQFIEMRFFGGMTIDEIAECTGVPKPTVYREVRVAQAWLFREAGPAGAAPK